jgi:hypothetical protein
MRREVRSVVSAQTPLHPLLGPLVSAEVSDA